jgi:predicted unusual protein kinase regulating ubiquinone biosynthesis (AarF/ABC1/UbiB family)
MRNLLTPTNGLSRTVDLLLISRRLLHIVAVVLRYSLKFVGALFTFLCRLLIGRPRQLLPPPFQNNVRDFIQNLGGIFVKLGQMLALRSDLLSREYRDAFLDLIDRAPAFSYEQVEATFLHEFGRLPQAIFDSFEERPFATGSIGQVHRACRGDKVFAVKVRRPSSELTFAADVMVLRAFAAIIRWSCWRRVAWLETPLREFVGWTQDELDYRREAENARALAERGHFADGVIPKVLLATEQIIAFDFLNGPTVLEQLRPRHHQDLPGISLSRVVDHNQIAGNLIHHFLQNALGQGIFHADPHPGNLLILSGNRVGYVDFGICGVLSPSSRRNLIGMSMAYSWGDLEELCVSFLRICDVNNNSKVPEFWRDFQRSAGDWRQNNQPGFAGSIANAMMGMFTLCRKYGILPKRDVVKYIKATIALESVLKLIVPGMDVYAKFTAVLTEHPEWLVPSFIKAGDAIRTSLKTSSDHHLATREFVNILTAVRHFGAIDVEDLIQLNESTLPTIQALRVVDPYYALWAMEGWGFSIARGNSDVQKNKMGSSLEVTFSVETHDWAAVLVGQSLACARQLLLREPLSISSVVSSFLEACSLRCPPSCAGVAAEALGFAVRTLRPDSEQDVATALAEQCRVFLPFFWHGVGRAIYFLFPRILEENSARWISLTRAIVGIESSLAKNNLLAGFAWPLFLVNIRHPEILAHFLSEHGVGLLHEDGFVHGMSTAIRVWVAWAGNDKHLQRLKSFGQRNCGRDFAFLWQRYIFEPAVEAVEKWKPLAQEPTFYVKLFRYLPEQEDGSAGIKPT